MPSKGARALAVVPLVILVAWAAVLAKDVLATKVYEDPTAIAARVDAIDSYEGHTEPLTLDADTEADARIWVLGSSSVAAPHRDAFTRPLVAALDDAGKRVQITNIGWEGMTSWDLAARLQTALTMADEQSLSIDGLVLYLGHNDITYTYHYALAMPRFDALIGPVWVAMGEPFRERDAGNAYWLFAHRRVPRILDALQQVGWLDLEMSTFDPLLKRASSRFDAELQGMLDTLATRGVPVLIVTPIGNLESRPHGVLDVTTATWEAALEDSEDPQERMQRLREAVDSEIFTPDMRAKDALIDRMRAAGVAPSPGAAVQICDLFERLPARGLYMGEDMFYDPVHLTESGFAAVTGIIADCLDEGILHPTAEAE